MVYAWVKPMHIPFLLRDIANTMNEIYSSIGVSDDLSNTFNELSVLDDSYKELINVIESN
jgi:hypothetical protein